MNRFIGILGIIAILGIAYLLSNNKKNIDKRLIIWGLGLQLFFGIFILVTPFGKPIFSWCDKAINKLLSFSQDGSNFLFASFVYNEMHPSLINFAFYVLPTVIFFSALMSVLYHLGLMQKIIKAIAWVMQKTMKASGPETTSISANIFVGQTEAPLVIKPYIQKMTNSELMAIMTGGFATVAGGVMAIYVGMLQNVPGIAGHLMAASIMSAPAALVIAKIMYPESEKVNTDKEVDFTSNLNEPVEGNVLESLGNGATEGLKLAANIAAMLIAFVALVSLTNYMLNLLGTSLETIFGYIFMPLAFLMGAPWSESDILGSLLGQKIVLTELIAYMNLSKIKVGFLGLNIISEKTAILASYALCGFANFASIGIQLGGIGSIAPERKKDLAKLVTKAMFGGALASWLTATIAGILITVNTNTFTIETNKSFNYSLGDNSNKNILYEINNNPENIRAKFYEDNNELILSFIAIDSIGVFGPIELVITEIEDDVEHKIIQEFFINAIKSGDENSKQNNSTESK